MGLFNKKTEREELLESKHYIENMAQYCDILISLAQENDILVEKLEEIKDKVKYFNPTKNSDTIILDKKIKNKLEDFKIEITKSKSKEDYSIAIKSADDLLNTLIVERVVLANRK